MHLKAIILPFENIIIAKILKSFVIADQKVKVAGKQNMVIKGKFCGLWLPAFPHFKECLIRQYTQYTISLN